MVLCFCCSCAAPAFKLNVHIVKARRGAQYLPPTRETKKLEAVVVKESQGCRQAWQMTGQRLAVIDQGEAKEGMGWGAEDAGDAQKGGFAYSRSE
jgi:hypothetical protein